MVIPTLLHLPNSVSTLRTYMLYILQLRESRNRDQEATATARTNFNHNLNSSGLQAISLFNLVDLIQDIDRDRSLLLIRD
jgi:hypothetical protein